VRGYKEEGTTTTPFDMVVRNDLDRYHLTLDAIDRLPEQPKNVAYIKQDLRDKLIEHRQYVTKYGDDLPAVKEWRWPEA
jgi:xylulose-5-phosphate/fructose-6-phosphate phosphoketolase